MSSRIHVSYTPVDHKRLSDVLSKYDHRSHQDMIADFEACLRDYTGKECVALNCGTSALHLALRALDVQPGDIVIAPTFTYVATVNPVLYVGAEPVLIDCERDTWNMDLSLLEKAILSCKARNKKPKAVIIVHTYGMPQDMKAVLQLCKSHDIKVVEDAAESIGTSINGRATGSFGDIGILSFNNNKTLTTYGGGAVICQDRRVAEKIYFWAAQSREPKPYYYHAELGYNYRMSPLNAAMGLANWPQLAQLVDERRANFQVYVNALQPLGWRFPMVDSSEPNRWFTVALFPPGKGVQFRDKCLEVFTRNNIELRFLWNPLHVQPLFRDCLVFDQRVSTELFETGICLPSGNGLKKEDLEKIIGILRNIS